MNESLTRFPRCPVAIVGAGPIGLAAARDLALHGISSVILDAGDGSSIGSRAICWSKRTLEIFDRLGCVRRMIDKGVVWNTGKVFFGDSREPVYSFDLLPDRNQRFPAFINLQQYYVERFLADTVLTTPQADLRRRSPVVGVEPHRDFVRLSVESSAGVYSLDADYVIAADGSRSFVRRALGLDFSGEIFQDHFLIADVKMRAERPAERWFWFDPPFARGQSALLHKQPDDIWRLDFQLGWDIDRKAELDPDRVTAHVARMLGADAKFELEWSSIYTFACRQLERFVHGRVIFAGDSAHLLSPFGARGANGGIQDVDNLCWKLALVLKGIASPRLLESYDAERVAAARENILHSTRSSSFITPKNPMSRAFRDAALELSREHAFARAFVNSGRLSMPSHHGASPLNLRCAEYSGGLQPGSPASDAACATNGVASWFLPQLGGRFSLAVFGPPFPGAMGFDLPVPIDMVRIGAHGASGATTEVNGKLAEDLAAEPGTCLLFRPDQHLLARWPRFDADRIRAAVLHCLAGGYE